MMDKITVSLRIDKDLIIKLREMAAADERSLNYLVNKILLEAAVKSKNKTQPWNIIWRKFMIFLGFHFGFALLD